MKQKLLFLVFTILLISPTFSQTVIWQEDFETDGNGSRYTVSNEFIDTQDDYFGRIHGPSLEYGFNGSGQVITLTGTGNSSSQIGN